jgi:hypothetical protein
LGVEDDAILELLKRLARPNSSGGMVIERAAILAEGAELPAVLEWIVDHAGQPEAAVASASGGGLYGSRINDGREAAARQPLRFVLPADALT